MKKKTIKFSAEEEHNQFEKTRVEPTKLFDVNDLDLSKPGFFDEFNELSTSDLEYKIEFEKLSKEELEIIKAILKSRE